MRRFACHYLYASADGCYARYVVELEDDGRLRRYFPLTEELSSTQWIGGIIVLSPLSELVIRPQERFADFLRRATAETGTEAPVYAWHIACADLPAKELTPESRVSSL